MALFADDEWASNIGGDLDIRVDQHAGDFHDDSFLTTLEVFKFGLDNGVWDVGCHDATSFVSTNSGGDENAFGRGGRAGSFLFGKQGRILEPSWAQRPLLCQRSFHMVAA